MLPTSRMTARAEVATKLALYCWVSMPRKNFLDDENTDVGPMSLVCAGGPDSRDSKVIAQIHQKKSKKNRRICAN